MPVQSVRWSSVLVLLSDTGNLEPETDSARSPSEVTTFPSETHTFAGTLFFRTEDPRLHTELESLTSVEIMVVHTPRDVCIPDLRLGTRGTGRRVSPSENGSCVSVVDSLSVETSFGGS